MCESLSGGLELSEKTPPCSVPLLLGSMASSYLDHKDGGSANGEDGGDDLQGAGQRKGLEVEMSLETKRKRERKDAEPSCAWK